MLVRDKCSNFLDLFLIYKRQSVVNTVPGSVFTALRFLCNLCTSTINYSVILHQARNTCWGHMLELFGPICKFGRKQSVMNMVPGTVFSTLYFLLNLWIGPVSWSFKSLLISTFHLFLMYVLLSKQEKFNLDIQNYMLALIASFLYYF